MILRCIFYSVCVEVTPAFTICQVRSSRHAVLCNTKSWSLAWKQGHMNQVHIRQNAECKFKTKERYGTLERDDLNTAWLTVETICSTQLVLTNFSGKQATEPKTNNLYEYCQKVWKYMNKIRQKAANQTHTHTQTNKQMYEDLFTFQSVSPGSLPPSMAEVGEGKCWLFSFAAQMKQKPPTQCVPNGFPASDSNHMLLPPPHIHNLRYIKLQWKNSSLESNKAAFLCRCLGSSVIVMSQLTWTLWTNWS